MSEVDRTKAVLLDLIRTSIAEQLTTDFEESSLEEIPDNAVLIAVKELLVELLDIETARTGEKVAALDAVRVFMTAVTKVAKLRGGDAEALFTVVDDLEARL